ncbi:MAG: MoxR family ATPase [Reyranella sp.]|nr:MoxR family ATPase [Reyranella sp.]
MARHVLGALGQQDRGARVSPDQRHEHGCRTPYFGHGAGSVQGEVAADRWRCHGQSGCQSPAALGHSPHNFVNRHALVPASILSFPQTYSLDDRSALVAPDTSTATDADAQAALADIERLGGQLRAARTSIGKVIYGQQDVIDQTLVALLSGGHLLLIGVPGLAKTKLVDTLGVVLGMESKRIQFTPDLMPADILGSEILEEGEGGRRSFRFLQGPVFAQLLMADEINRASPRTQSALLQSMQEKHVTVAGKRYDLPTPFHVLATQNPLEQEGTYPLPEAQLDRFLLQVDVGYPDEEAERQIMIGTTGAEQAVATQALSPGDLMAAQALVRRLPIGESVVDAILKLVRAGRPEHTDLDVVRQRVAWGPGPRASQAFMLACRARAIIQGRLAPSVDDVVALAGPILRHRMAVNFSARAEGVTVESVIAQMCARLG